MRESNLTSVVIVNYNCGHWLGECVRRVLASTIPVQVIVSDNGSGDGSVEMLEQMLKERTEGAEDTESKTRSVRVVRLRHAATGHPVGPAIQNQPEHSGAVFSPDGRTVMAAAGDGTGRLFDLATERPIAAPLTDQTGPIGLAT